MAPESPLKSSGGGGGDGGDGRGGDNGGEVRATFPRKNQNCSKTVKNSILVVRHSTALKITKLLHLVSLRIMKSIPENPIMKNKGPIA